MWLLCGDTALKEGIKLKRGHMGALIQLTHVLKKRRQETEGRP